MRGAGATLGEMHGFGVRLNQEGKVALSSRMCHHSYDRQEDVRAHIDAAFCKYEWQLAFVQSYQNLS